MLHLQRYFNIEILLDYTCNVENMLHFNKMLRIQWWENVFENTLSYGCLTSQHLPIYFQPWSSVACTCLMVIVGGILYSTLLGQCCPVNGVACCCDVVPTLDWFRKNTFGINIEAALRKKLQQLRLIDSKGRATRSQDHERFLP